MMPREIPMPHPGEILLEDFLKPMGLSVYALAKATGVNRARINEVVHGQRAVTADTALRLAKYFGTTPELWLNLQTRYDLTKAQEEMSDTLARIEPRAA